MRSFGGWFLLFLAPVALSANESGLPVGRTGGFGEPTCMGAGCHRPEPLNTGKAAAARIEVGPYVPGAKQRVRVIIESFSGNRWGFQLAARARNNNALSPGTFEAVNQFVAIRCAGEGFFAPCTGGRAEYATHTAVGSNPGGTPGRQTFFFDWTAPGSDVGPIDFAAATLAADGDRGTNNDLTTTATATSLFAPTNSPSINSGGVTGAAAPGRDPITISPQQLISVFGANLNAPGTAIEVTQRDFDAQGRVPEVLNRLSLRFNIPGDPRDFLGRMVFVGERQANAQAPDFPAGTSSAMVRAVVNRGAGNSEVVSSPVSVAVERSAPGLFTFGGSGAPWPFGEGAAAAVDAATGRIVAPAVLGVPNSTRAAPGSVILLFGTGFGATDPKFPMGELASGIAPLVNNVQATIGGMQAEVLFAGAAPNFLGLIQVNIRVPAGLPPGEHVLVIRQPPFITQTRVFVEVGP